MKLTPAQTHAILLLEIQDAKRGWARLGTLRQCGVMPRTLVALQAHAAGRLVELDIPPDVTRSYDWRYRLTGPGEREAARLKKIGWSANPKGAAIVTESVTETVTETVRP